MTDAQDLFQLEKELHEAKDNLGKLAAQMKKSARVEIEAKADYEAVKNKTLLELFEEEARRGLKRTIAKRQAIYRTKHESERRKMFYAQSDAIADRDVYRGVLAKIEILRTLISLEKAKLHL